MAIPGSALSLTETELGDLLSYLKDEFSPALDEHRNFCDQLQVWDNAYLGKPKETKKSFPWPGASNLVIPVIGIHTDSIVARIVNTIFGVDPLWTIRPLRKEVDAYAKPAEAFLDWSQKNELFLYQEIKSWTIEVVKFGVGWLKQCWDAGADISVVGSSDTGEVTINRQAYRRPSVKHVLAIDVVSQAGVEDTDQAEWKAHRFRLTKTQIKQQISIGILQQSDADKILASNDDLEQVKDYLAPDKASGESKLWTFYEVYLTWPYGPGKTLLPMIVTYHAATNLITRVILNTLGFDPLIKAHFIEREGRKQGLGIAQRLWMLQESLSTLHNQQVDNATLANTRFFLGRRGAVKPNTQIWPGRFLPVSDPERDIKPMQLGEIYPSMERLEQSELSYAERSSGVSDYQLGRESPIAGSSATATGTLALIQEGNRRFDLNIRDMRDVLSRVGRNVLTLNQRFRPEGVAYFVQGADGEYVEQLFQMPEEMSIAGFAVELTASTATINKEVEKQSLMALNKIVGDYYMQMNQTAMGIINPQIPESIRQLMLAELQGSKHIMDRLVQTFDFKAVDTIIPQYVPIELMNGQVDAQAQMMQQQGAGGAGGGVGEQAPGQSDNQAPSPGMDMASGGMEGSSSGSSNSAGSPPGAG